MNNASKILIPLCAPQNASQAVRQLSRFVPPHPAEIYLVEVNLPPGFFRWLFALFIDQGARRRQQLLDAQRLFIWREQLPCEAREMRAPNLVIGIAEAALRTEPALILLAPDLIDRLGPVGVEALVNRLSGVCRCMIVALGYGLSWETEPAGRQAPLDSHRLVR